MRTYRIGEFARKLGVSPDFLKYQERLGTIRAAERTDADYRYYQFRQSLEVFEILRCKGFGFTAKETAALMDGGNFDAVVDAIVALRPQLREKLSLDAAVLARIDELERIRDLSCNGEAWYVTRSEAFYLLPQTENDAYLDYSGFDAACEAWSSLFPVVDTTALVRPDGSYSWGLSASKAFVEERPALPLQEAVEIPAQRCFEMYMRTSLSDMFPDTSVAAFGGILARPLEIMGHHGLEAAGDAYLTVYYYTPTTEGAFVNVRAQVPIS